MATANAHAHDSIAVYRSAVVSSGLMPAKYAITLAAMSARILLVEDEESLQDIIRLNLELEGYDVTAVGNGRQALQVFGKDSFNLVILDVMLPEVDGFTICQTIRLSNTLVPVLFLTAKDSAEDRVYGLRIGGDDYLSKPFNLEEMLLRVQRLLARGQRGGVAVPDIVAIGRGSVNFSAYEAIGIDGTVHRIGQREVQLLRLFVSRRGEVVSRDTIMDEIWGRDADTTARSIDNYIVQFRRWFEADQRVPEHFISVRGVGYRFVG